MRILGIDPGFAIVGYGVIDSEKGKSSVVDYGVITTPKEEKLPARLHMIYDDLAALIDKFKPDCMAIEELFHQEHNHGYRRGGGEGSYPAVRHA